MRKGLAIIAILLCVGMLQPFGVRAAAGQFKDLSDRHWAKSAILEAVAKGYVNGYSDGTFRPDRSITRAEVAAMLNRVTKLTEGDNPNPIVLPGTDKHWARDHIRKLVSLGVISAADYTKGFEPDKAITRYELMKWMASGLARSESSMAQALKDTKDTLLPTPESFNGGIKPEQIPYIALVRGTGVVNGYADGSFKPSEQATRAEVLTMMLRYEKVEGTKAEGYSDLNEMRAIGVEKTNIEVISGYRFGGDNYKFTNIVGKTLKFPDMDVVIHQMVAVDLTTEAQKGLYAQIFVGKDRKPHQKGFFYLFFESTVTMKTDKYNSLKLFGDINYNNNIYDFLRVDDDVSSRLGLTVVPGDNPGKFMTKGTPRRVWSSRGIPSSDGDKEITASDGSKFILEGNY